jgi:hypothetical protein
MLAIVVDDGKLKIAIKGRGSGCHMPQSMRGSRMASSASIEGWAPI